MCVCIYLYIYIYMYVYNIYIYIYIYIYIHTHAFDKPRVLQSELGGVSAKPRRAAKEGQRVSKNPPAY